MKDYRYSDLYFMDSVDKQMVMEVIGTDISIDNSMIEQGSFSLTETLCSQSDLTFGACEPNYFTVTVHDMPRSIKGETIVVREYLGGTTDNPFPYGVYKVYSDVPTSDRTKREITTYDALYDIVNADMKQWYAGLSFPMTLRQFRDSFFSYFGIKQKDTTLVNDSMIVNKTLVATQTDSESTITEESAISGKTIITAICEINGVFGNINRDGEFEYVELKEIISPLYPANDLYPSDDLFPREPNAASMSGHYITFDYEDFQTKQITQLEIRPADDSAGTVVGASGNSYVITGNFLVSDKSGAELETIAANTLSIIRKASYTPLKSSEVVGNPCIELGDPIRFNTTREIVESYVLQRTLTGIQNKRDSIVSPGTEIHSQNPNSIRDQIESVQRRTNKLERTADHTLSELADLDANTTSRFEQTAEQIQTEVSNRQNADNEMSTKISQTAHSIGLTASGGNNSVGITIRLYDENGNLIDTESGDANITIVGVVKFEDLQNAGQTIINGANISTGYISCDRLNGGTISGQTIEGCTISGGIIKLGEKLYLYNPRLGDYQEIMYCDGNYVYFSPTDISTNTVHASTFIGDVIGSISNASYASTAGGVSNGGLKDYSGRLTFNDSTSGNTGQLYYKSYNGLYVITPSSSSRNIKHDIMNVCNEDLYPRRLYNLRVVQFKYNNLDVDDPLYEKDVIGLIAEEVAEAYPLGAEYDENGNPTSWWDRYLIPPMIYLIQEQHEDIESLKQENLELKNRLSILEQRMEELEHVINNKINQS